jgi:hypothetical protein
MPKRQKRPSFERRHNGATVAKERDPVSALTGFEAAVGLVDDINAALAAHDAVVAMTTAQRFQGVANFHNRSPDCGSTQKSSKYPCRPLAPGHATFDGALEKMAGNYADTVSVSTGMPDRRPPAACAPPAMAGAAKGRIVFDGLASAIHQRRESVSSLKNRERFTFEREAERFHLKRSRSSPQQGVPAAIA